MTYRHIYPVIVVVSILTLATALGFFVRLVMVPLTTLPKQEGEEQAVREKDDKESQGRAVLEQNHEEVQEQGMLQEEEIQNVDGTGDTSESVHSAALRIFN
jgi:flagellar biosynthesis/type III secretory pathway M-ring protein FliF/YscJ